MEGWNKAISVTWGTKRSRFENTVGLIRGEAPPKNITDYVVFGFVEVFAEVDFYWVDLGAAEAYLDIQVFAEDFPVFEGVVGFVFLLDFLDVT